MTKILSYLSLLISVLVLILKIQFDITCYKLLDPGLGYAVDGISPSMVAGVIRFGMLHFVPAGIGLGLGIFSRKLKNRFSILALTFSILTMIYLFIPAGFVRALF